MGKTHLLTKKSIQNMTEYIGEEMKITEDGGVIKKMIKQGEDQKPAHGEMVHVHYEGRLEDGTVFDSSYERGDPLTISIGTGQVIKGWDQGIMAMNLGEKADLIIKSDYGYGDAGSPPKIPGGATLIFTVELVQIGDQEAGAMPDDERLKTALTHKDEGNGMFKAKKLKEAQQAYKEGIEHVEKIRKDTEETKKLAVTLY